MTGDQSQITSSASAFISGYDKWTEMSPLPVAMLGLRVVSLNNQIIAIGMNKSVCVLPLHA